MKQIHIVKSEEVAKVYLIITSILKVSRKKYIKMVILKLFFSLSSDSTFSKCHDNVMKTIVLPQGFGIALKLQVV